jgi:hypothetical protein
VSATVGGRVIPLTLVAGTPTAGTWRGSVGSLPAGSWPVAFAAVTEKGNQPSLAGPTLTVGAPVATPAPTPPRPAPTSSVDATDPPGSGPGAGPGAGASVAPQPTAAPSAAAAPSEPHPISGAPSSPPPSHATPAPTRSAGERGGETGTGPSAPPEGGGAPAPGQSAGSAPERSPTGAGRALSQAAELNPWLAPLAAICAAGAALIGLYLLLGRRRSDGDETAVPLAAMAPLPGAPTRDEASELLVRRTLRRARVRLPEDPIVAAIGIDDDAPPDAATPDGPRAMERSAASGRRRAVRRD